jgi:hypothetical protein
LNVNATGTYLKDVTGNVRFLPVPLGYGKEEGWEVDLKLFKEKWESEILPSTIHAWRMGENHLFSKEEKILHQDYVSTKEVDNEYDGPVQRFLNQQQGIQFKDFGFHMDTLKKYLRDVEEIRGPYSNMNISRALHKCGYVNEPFTMIPAERRYFGDDRSSPQIKLWIPKGMKGHVKSKRSGGDVPDTFAFNGGSI